MGSLKDIKRIGRKRTNERFFRSNNLSFVPFPIFLRSHPFFFYFRWPALMHSTYLLCIYRPKIYLIRYISYEPIGPIIRRWSLSTCKLLFCVGSWHSGSGHPEEGARQASWRLHCHQPLQAHQGYWLCYDRYNSYFVLRLGAYLLMILSLNTSVC